MTTYRIRVGSVLREKKFRKKKNADRFADKERERLKVGGFGKPKVKVEKQK